MANGSALQTLDDTLDLYLVKKAPRLPDNWREILVKFLPWLTLIFFVLMLPMVLVLFGLGTFLIPFAYLGGISAGNSFTLSLVVLAVSLVLAALAIPGLFNRSKGGWNLLYWSALINGVYNLVSLNLLGAILGTLITLYLLFQVRGYYH